MRLLAPEISFINAPVCTDLTALDADIAILGVPHGTPYGTGPIPATEAPRYLREKSMRFRRALGPYHNFDFDGELLNGQAVRVVDCGDVPGDPADVPGTVARATEAVRLILERGAVPIVLGGDDSIPIPVVRAYRDFGPIVVVQVDQHLDFKEEINGVREGYSSPMRRISEMPWVQRIVQLGQAGMGSALTTDLQDAMKAGNIIVTDHEFHEQGVEAVLRRIPDGGRYFITIDGDGLEPTIMPAVSHPEPGGLTFPETVALLRGLVRKGRVVGFDFAEFTPEHDLHALGAHTVGRLILNLIAAMVRAGQFARPRP